MTTSAFGSDPMASRRLTARSMILSAFLGAPAQARAPEIIALAQTLGLQESAVRVALTRLVAAGDLQRSDGTYSLSARLRERRERQDDARHPHLIGWNGQWTLVVVTRVGEGSSDRSALRESMRQLRFRELREGVWTRPNNLDVVLPERVTERSVVYSALPSGSAHELAHSLFDPNGWAETARRLLAEGDAAGSPAERFVLAAAMIRHLLDDPLLPSELLPDDWPGDRLRAAYEQFRGDFLQLAETHLGRVVSDSLR